MLINDHKYKIMNTPKELEKIYNKLPKEKVELAVHKVELNLIEDINKLSGEIQDEIDYGDELINKMDSKLVAVRNEIDELTEIKEESKGQVDNLKSMAADVKSIDAKVKDAAAALGVKPSDVKGYDFIQSQLKDANEKAKEVAFFIKSSNKYKN
tara:strand:+ start:551 stop:1012 length:462 start_codon:yes stop_codon:yes gene_type:complete